MAVDPIDLATIVTATRNFSKRNVIGEGAFGIVYEGNLPSDHPFVESLPGRKVAVKRVKLSSLPGRLLSDFTREVELVSELRHDNLVRLLAYCSDGNERILVYEYIKNRSLNLYIFGTPSARASLNWGVGYLHDRSGENVVHRDLKPSNVLLDHQWMPKIADFGTAKLFRDDQTGTQTVVVTPSNLSNLPGYAAPEYAKDGDMTLKCDVFSFGVVLLEIISGRKNSVVPSLILQPPGLPGACLRRFYLGDEIVQVWKLWDEHRVMDLLDAAVAPARHRSAPELLSELRRCIQIGLLCVQQSPGLDADGQKYADGHRRPIPDYADSWPQAVGVQRPSGYPSIRRQPPSAKNGRRHSQVYACSCRRHILAVGIAAGAATTRVTGG
ncbi:cysteine-rich receptor-like protein kinase 44 [Aegilops tauschii subsp. strangulata]|uniref:cysteine-rich receptor-like protein kinase 44 n=1 Tax=Aegilops tauschii subsp. strangulata TaxID=200361 RepID=UPI003CC8483A